MRQVTNFASQYATFRLLLLGLIAAFVVAPPHARAAQEGCKLAVTGDYYNHTFFAGSRYFVPETQAAVRKQLEDKGYTIVDENDGEPDFSLNIQLTLGDQYYNRAQTVSLEIRLDKGRLSYGNTIYDKT